MARQMLLVEFLRRRAGYNQTELANRLRVDQKRISEVENGLRNMPLLRALAGVFSMNENDAHTLLRPIPDQLNPDARAERLAAELDATFAAKPEPRRAAEPEAIPDPPSLVNKIRQMRGE